MSTEADAPVDGRPKISPLQIARHNKLNRRRYRTDPEYRARKMEQAKARYHRLKINQPTDLPTDEIR
jgi:hypothetical protein